MDMEHKRSIQDIIPPARSKPIRHNQMAGEASSTKEHQHKNGAETIPDTEGSLALRLSWLPSLVLRLA